MKNRDWTDSKWKYLEHQATHAAVREVCQECLLRIRELANYENAKRLNESLRAGRSVVGSEWIPREAQIREWIRDALQELALHREMPKKVKRLARAELADWILTQHKRNIWDACEAFLNTTEVAMRHRIAERLSTMEDSDV